MTSCMPLTHEAAPLTRLMIAYNNIEQVLAVSELTGPELLDFAGNCLTRTRAALATLDSLEADFPESVSAVGSREESREDSTVSGFTLSSRTRLRRRGGRRKGEAVITHTEDTDTATTETEAAAAAGEKKSGAVTMIMKRVIYQSSGKANSDS